MPDKACVDDLTKEFLAESMEGLDRMERCLTELELRPADSELLGEIFRAVHTIKGTTGFLGFGRLEKLAHAGENLLGALRDGTLEVTGELISGLLLLMDGLRKILLLIESTGGEGSRANDDDGSLIALLDDLSRQRTLHEEPRSELVVREASVAGAQAAPVDSGYVTERGANDKTLRIDVEVLNRMMNLVGELVLTRNQMLQSTMSAASFPELARRLDSVTADLRETVMQARMQPVGNLFNKFPRMVRDLARTCGKQVRLEFSGQETGLDKSLLEAIKDPLTHAVRNSVDHGIESPGDRLKSDKQPEGCVRLKAFHQSGSVVIEVSDDGAGISMERVLAKAVDRELVTAEQAAAMTEREALQLIFLPGFSTAAAVTHVSGRGVGMDVVRSNVEKVGGSVEMESRVGAGTTLRLRVPLTLAIVPALVVRSGGQSFALPQSALMELVYVPEREVADAIEQVGQAEVYRLRERLLPIVRLDELLEVPSTDRVGAHGIYVAVVEAEGRRYGLVVDDLLAPEEIVVKPLSGVLREIGLFSGATVLGNGLLALILDVAAVAERAGVRVAEPGISDGVEKSNAEEVEATRSFLVYEDCGRERKAMPLEQVERIESVPLDEVEYAAGRAMLQYRGETLVLRDAGGVLHDMEAGGTPAAEDAALVTVLICGVGALEGAVARVGVVVRKVLDVSSGVVLDEVSAREGTTLALVKERLTTVCGEMSEVAEQKLQEVA